MKSLRFSSRSNPTAQTVRNSNSRRRRGAARPILIALIAATLVGGGGYYWWKMRAESTASTEGKPILEQISKGPFDHIVLEQGEVESSSNNEVKCEVKGRGGSGTPILTVIPEGTFVKKGDILCELDSSALDQEAKNQRIIVSAAESTVISSEAAVSKAEIARQEYLEGTYLTERKTILSEISIAKQNLRKAELSLQSAERLAAKGTLKPLQIEAEQYAVQNAQSTLESAEARLRVLDELTKAKMLVQLDSDIATAKAKLDSDRNTLIEEKEKLDEILTQMAACQIKAPADGQVVYANKVGSRGGSDFVVEPGAVVREQQTVFLLPDPSKMQVKAKVNESRITLIREGMPVKIRVGAVENELLGRVVKVNKYAEPGNWWGSNVKEYAVFVQIVDPPETIRTGMTAEVRIFVEQIPEAIQIPILAVYETKGHHFVLVKSGDGWETKPIKIGAANEKFITVDTGIEVGEEVVLNPRNHLAKMDIPVIEETDDREQLARIAAEPLPAAAKTDSQSAGGGMDLSGMMQRIDTDSDGKISKTEASSMGPLAAGFPQADGNQDGFLDMGELTKAMQKLRAARERTPGAEGAPGPDGGPAGRAPGGSSADRPIGARGLQ
ncbi:macrolide transporter subunit MacA [Pirellula sp. SH-Sr6A]|uniref:HlyD family efflux transporter periplasmic adaptor subunit n=1 Tax=Pirellula sp. SH-Sr6A TaxID=1632865 RepID=UPI00078C7D75|nr:HlyD family efflux transporter periplasmic adaptor subunit [Pirellula sp. SH-Sr6A]AMV33585.1 macrolide transporter subunit MacA [Pirellula sp. SH-Sr6A]